MDLAWASSLPAASPPRNSGPPRWRWEMPSRSDRSRSSRVNAPLAPMQCHAGRSPFGTDRDHRRRGLLVGLLDNSPDLDALASEHVQQARREGVGPDRAEAAHLGSEPAQHDRRAAGGAGRREPDGLHQLSVGALRYGLDADHVRVEDVDADRGDLHDFSWLFMPGLFAPGLWGWVVRVVVDPGGGAVVALQCLRDDVGLLLVGEGLRGPELARSVVQGREPLEQQRVLDGLVE